MSNSRPDDISEDIYVGFVRSLFRGLGVLLIGAFCNGMIGLLVYLKTEEPTYLALGALTLFTSLYRYHALNKVDPSAIHDYASALSWERYYIVVGSIQGFCMGLFGFVSVIWIPDEFGQLAAISLVLASAVTIAGRNYGSMRMVAILTLTAIAPISLALMLRGDIYHIILGLFILPFMLAITRMASLVRTVLFSALSEEKKANRLAHQFDRALNTMSHGLLMLTPEGRVVVANAEAGRLMSADPRRLIGRSVKSLMMRGVAGGALSLQDSRYVEAQLTWALREGKDRKILISFNNGRHYEFSAREGHGDIGVVTFEDVTARVQAEEKIRYMARYDSLTKLPNRDYIQGLIADSMAVGDRSRLCGLAIIDLDDFKSVNDTLGHPIGDGLINAVAECLETFAGDNVKIGRFGGDEFIVYVDHLDDEQEIERFLEALFAGLQREVDIAGHILRIQASAGAVVCPVQEADVDSMIVKADLALYKTKDLGKNGWQLFEAKMDAEFRHKQLLKADLRKAVETGELSVVYQAIVSLDTMRIAGCEALCRWYHPELGPVVPAVFIPLAEEMGIISEITRFMLASACAECAKWPNQLGVSVNLSARDFGSREIVQTVRDALETAGLEPSRLEIEVTESALLDDKALTRTFLEELKSLGVRIALDDFGTGYSSLSYLHTLPLDKVKIDRSFLADIGQNNRSLDLLARIVDLSRSLGLSVTVEGVETFEQLRILSRKVKPDLLQGFLFGSALTGSGIVTIAHTALPFASERSFAAPAANAAALEDAREAR